MKNIILAYTGRYAFSDIQIKTLLKHKAYYTLWLGLKKYPPKTRKRILTHLQDITFQHNHLFKRLGKIIQEDGLENMELAYQIYQSNLSRHPAFRKKSLKVIAQYENRKRKAENRKAFFETYKHRFTGDLAFDRTKMETLAAVKNKLKSPVRYFG